MNFEESLDHALAMLQRRGRVSYRTLKLQFHLDEESLEALKEELIEVHHLAIDQDGRMLVWVGTVVQRLLPPLHTLLKSLYRQQTNRLKLPLPQLPSLPQIPNAASLQCCFVTSLIRRP
jgi:hypothetical protein